VKAVAWADVLVAAGLRWDHATPAREMRFRDRRGAFAYGTVGAAPMSER